MTDIAATLGAWIPQVQGRYLNEDGAYGAQCWDLAANWSKHLGLPVISTVSGTRGRWPGWAGNMVDAFPQTPAIGAAYELHGPGEYAQPGDILVWGDSYPAWFPKTHVAVAVRDFGAQILTVSQNSTASQPGNPYPQWTTGPSTIQHLPRRGLLGIIRPRAVVTVQGTTTEEEDDLMATKEQRAALIAELMTHPVTQPDGIVTNLESVIREYRSHVTASIEATGSVASQVLNTPIPRGGQPGETTLAAVASWHDAHIVSVIDAVTKATGADLGTIRQAVLDGLKQGLKVTVALEGTE
jgi:hypothetical protein